ncbi:hypothetical protein SCUP515_04944 [Seiridium cupressi]
MSSDEEYDPQEEEVPQEDEEMADDEIVEEEIREEMEDLDEEEEEQEQEPGSFWDSPVSWTWVKEIRDAIAPIAQRAYDRRMKGAGHRMGAAEKISEIVDLCAELTPEMLIQVQTTVRALRARIKQPRPSAIPKGGMVQHMLDRMPQPDDAGFGLDPVEQVQIQQKMDSDARSVRIRDADVSQAKHTAFWADWRTISAAGTCPTELISARQYLKFQGDELLWAPVFYDYLKNLVLGSPCGKNYALLGCFIRLTVASRMDDHRAVPLSNHGKPDGSFFDVFAGEMLAKTDGKSLKEVYASAKAKWIGGGKTLPWESRALTALEDHLRRLIKVFDDSAMPSALTAREFQSVVDKAKSFISVNKKHRNPVDMEGIRRLRERSFLLDMYFTVHQQQPALVSVPGQGVQPAVEPDMDNGELPVEGAAEQDDPFEGLGGECFGLSFGGDDESPPPIPQKRTTEDAEQPDPKRRKAELTQEQRLEMMTAASGVSVGRPVFLAESSTRPMGIGILYEPKFLNPALGHMGRSQSFESATINAVPVKGFKGRKEPIGTVDKMEPGKDCKGHTGTEDRTAKDNVMFTRVTTSRRPLLNLSTPVEDCKETSTEDYEEHHSPGLPNLFEKTQQQRWSHT